jgi:hypothetical protein
MPPETELEGNALPPYDEAAAAAIIAQSKPEDYDGHTEFHRLSPRARLEWLDSAVQFFEMVRQARECRERDIARLKRMQNR